MSSNNGNGSKNRGITRRDFFKWSAAAGAAGTALDWAVVGPKVAGAAHTDGELAKTICPYCSVGCGVSVRGSGSTVTDVIGDPTNVTSRGGLCSKGAASVKLINNNERVGLSTSTSGITGPAYRDGNSTTWTVTTWTAAMTDIATRLVTARGASVAPGENKEGVAFLGCAHMTNEENNVYRKLIANFGTNNIEHQARI